MQAALAILLALGVATNGASTVVRFKLKNCEARQCVVVSKNLLSVEGVGKVGAAKDGALELTVKAGKSVKLSEVRAAVAKAGDKIEIAEDEIVLGGKVWIHTSLSDGLAGDGLKALQKLFCCGSQFA